MDHERIAAVERADGGAVVVDDLELDGALEHALDGLDVDAGEGVAAVEQQLDLVVRRADLVHRLEHQAHVLEARQVGGHDHEQPVGGADDVEAVVVEALVQVDHHVVVQRAQRLDDACHVVPVLADQLGLLGARRRQQQVDAGAVVDDQVAQQLGVDARRRHRVDDGVALGPRSRKTRWSPNWRLASTRHDLALQLAMQRDGGVDGQGRGAHATLGAVERVDLAARRVRPVATPAAAGTTGARAGRRAGDGPGPRARRGGPA